ncbi:MAG: hypothetical protein AABX90_03265 [Nanoarchaeota archaeon]
MMKHTKGKTMKLKMTGDYPCPWDDLINESKKVHVTIHTLKSVKKDPLLKLSKEGITFDKKERINDIVIDVSELTEKIVRNSLKKLSKITGVNYKLGKARKRYVSMDI